MDITEKIKEKKLVFTIARQYGSGGRTIGAMLSERLGIPYYDKDLLKLASEKSGIHEGLFGQTDEKIKMKKTSLLFHIVKNVYQGQRFGPESGDYTSRDNLFSLQASVIEQLAENESCIIIGRCGDYVLREYDNVLSVFVHAPEDYCLEQAAKKTSMKDRELKRFISTTDRERAEYYRYFTGRNWTDARNYDLCLDSSKLGFERCVDEIIGYATIRFGL